MIDLKFLETGNGGDLRLKANDLVGCYGYENMPYLGMFGGRDFWGNALLFDGNAAQAFVDTTEAALEDNPLNSGGRILIENAMKNDLQFLLELSPGAELIIQTEIAAVDRLNTRINFGGEDFYTNWNISDEKTNNNYDTRIHSSDFGDEYD